MATFKTIGIRRFVARCMAEDAKERRGKRERWQSTREIRAETAFRRFRPYHICRDGKPRLGSYDTRHCSQSVRNSEAIEAFFHARKMRAAGYHLGGMGVEPSWHRYSPHKASQSTSPSLDDGGACIFAMMLL